MTWDIISLCLQQPAVAPEPCHTGISTACITISGDHSLTGAKLVSLLRSSSTTGRGWFLSVMPKGVLPQMFYHTPTSKDTITYICRSIIYEVSLKLPQLKSAIIHTFGLLELAAIVSKLVVTASLLWMRGNWQVSWPVTPTCLYIGCWALN